MLGPARWLHSSAPGKLGCTVFLGPQCSWEKIPGCLLWTPDPAQGHQTKWSRKEFGKLEKGTTVTPVQSAGEAEGTVICLSAEEGSQTSGPPVDPSSPLS